MAFSDYRFVTHWRIRGQIEKVFEILKDGKRYAEWWRPAYLKSEEIGPQKVRSTVRARLPYTLIFTTELVKENRPYEIVIRATGELEGTGRWQLKEAGPLTEIQFFWNVRANKPLVRWLSPLLKPLFRWNHDWVMSNGLQTLQDEINRRIN